MRSSNINKLRKLRHAQAVLLGCTFEKRYNSHSEYSHFRWCVTGPSGLSCIYREFNTRHDAVTYALTWLKVINCFGDVESVLPDAAKI